MEIKIYKPENHKVKAVIYGASGAGKTTFGATAPKPIFASAEAGLLSVADQNLPYAEIKSIYDLQELMLFLQKGGHGYETVVIDSITEINDIIKTDIEKTNKRSMQLQDWGVLAKKINNILRGFRGLDMNVIFIAQEQNITDEDKISKIVPSLNGKAATNIAYFMDVVGYLKLNKLGERELTVTPTHNLLTKDRSGKLTDNVLDFTEWCKAVKGVKIGKENIVKDTNKTELPDDKWDNKK